MARFHRSRLDRIEQRIRPAAPKHPDISNLGNMMVKFSDLKGLGNCHLEDRYSELKGAAREREIKAAERVMNDEMRKIFGITEWYSGEDIIKAFLELGRDRKTAGRN